MPTQVLPLFLTLTTLMFSLAASSHVNVNGLFFFFFFLLHRLFSFKTQRQNTKIAIRKICFAAQVLPLLLFIFLLSSLPNQILELFGIIFRKKSKSEEEKEISLQTVRVSEKVFPSLLLISYSILCL